MKVLILILFCLSVSLATAAEKVVPFILSPQATELMENYCFDCHDGESKKGEVRLDNLGTLVLKDGLAVATIGIGKVIVFKRDRRSHQF